MNNSMYPCLILFDFDYSEFNYNNHKIYSKVPFSNLINYPLGKKKTIEYKRYSDIVGLNNVLSKIGIKKKIKLVNCKNNINLILNKQFDNFKITIEKYKQLLKDKKKILIFSFN